MWQSLPSCGARWIKFVKFSKLFFFLMLLTTNIQWPLNNTYNWTLRQCLKALNYCQTLSAALSYLFAQSAFQTKTFADEVFGAYPIKTLANKVSGAYPIK